MDPQRFELVQEILALAMERPTFIGTRCGNDAELKSEVESLLAVSEDAGDFFDSLAGRAWPDLPRMTRRSRWRDELCHTSRSRASSGVAACERSLAPPIHGLGAK